MITKKDYELIAKSFFYVRKNMEFLSSEQRQGAMVISRGIAYSLCDTLFIDNPRFNRATFLKACGIEE